MRNGRTPRSQRVGVAPAPETPPPREPDDEDDEPVEDGRPEALRLTGQALGEPTLLRCPRLAGTERDGFRLRGLGALGDVELGLDHDALRGRPLRSARGERELGIGCVGDDPDIGGLHDELLVHLVDERSRERL